MGFDAGKLVKGRKRLVLIDTQGNVLASRVVPAHVSDAAAAIAFWDEVALTHPLLGRVQLVMGDSSFAGLFAEHLARHYGVQFEKPTHIVLKKKNFCIHQKRWLVERTLAWLNANRRFVQRIRPPADAGECLVNLGQRPTNPQVLLTQTAPQKGVAVKQQVVLWQEIQLSGANTALFAFSPATAAIC